MIWSMDLDGGEKRDRLRCACARAENKLQIRQTESMHSKSDYLLFTRKCNTRFDQDILSPVKG